MKNEVDEKLAEDTPPIVESLKNMAPEHFAEVTKFVAAENDRREEANLGEKLAGMSGQEFDAYCQKKGWTR